MLKWFAIPFSSIGIQIKLNLNLKQLKEVILANVGGHHLIHWETE